ncbi:MAG: ABC transporter ATP-binding protein [Alphaproteobacteria bacterium]|nr:ABC transporter ATP-binding protein [Alphaproteobacteria bacterium]
MAAVTLRAIEKAFGHTTVLKGVSLDIADGEFLTLLGPSGCGKSTLLRIIAGLELQDSGSVAIGQEAVDGLRPKQRDVAMVFQSYALYPHLTARQNMALPLRMRRLGRWQRLPLFGRLMPGARSALADIEREVARTAEALEIGHVLDRKPSQLSGGQRQRVAVGRAMVRRPSVFLMDEPLSNLDAKLRVQMRAEIIGLHRRLGVTFVYVTHDQAEAMTMSNRVAVMLDSGLLQVAPPHLLYNDPETLRVAEFVGSPKINVLAGKINERGIVDAAGTRFALAGAEQVGSALRLAIRPEAIDCVDRAGINVMTGVVRHAENLGSDLFVHVDVPGHSSAVIARLPPERGMDVAPGRTIHLGIRTDRILVFEDDGRRRRPGFGNVTPLRSYGG